MSEEDGTSPAHSEATEDVGTLSQNEEGSETRARQENTTTDDNQRREFVCALAADDRQEDGGDSGRPEEFALQEILPLSETGDLETPSQNKEGSKTSARHENKTIDDNKRGEFLFGMAADNRQEDGGDSNHPEEFALRVIRPLSVTEDLETLSQTEEGTNTSALHENTTIDNNQRCENLSGVAAHNRQEGEGDSVREEEFALQETRPSTESSRHANDDDRVENIDQQDNQTREVTMTSSHEDGNQADHSQDSSTRDLTTNAQGSGQGRARRPKRKMHCIARTFLVLNIFYVTVSIAYIVWGATAIFSDALPAVLGLAQVNITLPVFMIILSTCGIVGALQDEHGPILPFSFFAAALILFHVMLCNAYLLWSNNDSLLEHIAAQWWERATSEEKEDQQNSLECCGLDVRNRENDPSCYHLDCCSSEPTAPSNISADYNFALVVLSNQSLHCPQCQTCQEAMVGLSAAVVRIHVFVWLIVCVLEIIGQVLGWMIWVCPEKFHYKYLQASGTVVEIQMD
ncbi:uncharacterized protein [Ptychodera flava]|uniref:uncharacterized protein n=1 Tax=Ptychodera flava TaxID=63121 RepID=UPI00396A3351